MDLGTFGGGARLGLGNRGLPLCGALCQARRWSSRRHALAHLGPAAVAILSSFGGAEAAACPAFLSAASFPGTPACPGTHRTFTVVDPSNCLNAGDLTVSQSISSFRMVVKSFCDE